MSNSDFDSLQSDRQIAVASACEHAAVGMALLDANQRVHWMNPALREMLGYGEYDLDAGWQAIVHPDDRLAHAARMEQICSGAIDSFHVENRWIHKLGHTVRGQETAAAVRNPAGGESLVLCHLHGLVADQAASVRRERSFAEGLVQTAQAVVLVLDSQQRILRINPYTEELTGYTQDELDLSDWSSLLPEENRAAAREMFLAAVAGSPVRRATYPLVAKDQMRHEIEWSSRALMSEQGEVTGVLFIGHDITELRQAQVKLLASERLAAIGQMSSGLAHESRNALQQICACAEMLAMELTELPEALDLLSGIQEAEGRLHRLFDDVRAYAVRLQMDLQQASLPDVWRAAWSAVVAANPRRQIRLVEEVLGGAPRATVDATHLEQAFQKIFENAIDACPDPVEVRIRCEPSTLDNRAVVKTTIEDSGQGFSREAVTRAFEPFYSTKTQGTGLGLPIVKRVVEAHGGEITWGNTAERGARIEITLPVMPDVNRTA